jgi:Flp pilus assembly protein CpaB
MEMEYRDPARRSRFVVIVGVLLAVLAGAAAFYLVNQAQQQAQLAGGERQTIVVAARDIPARAALEAADIVLLEVPVDGTTATGVFTDPTKILGLITSVPILTGQPVFANMLAGQTLGSQFSILGPDESVSPESPIWRAIAITVPDDRAVGGLVEVGQAVDVVVTAQITLPDALVEEGKYYSDRVTKVIYQDMVVLAKTATTYIVKATIDVAEELGHFQASGVASFTLLVRPVQDLRPVDMSILGTTTNRIIERYGLPLPEVYPPGSGPIVPPSPTPVPSESPAVEPSTTPAPSIGSN